MSRRVATTIPRGCVCYTEEDCANARLIAAAPQLLQALIKLQANPNDPRMHHEAMNAMEAATGKQPKLQKP